MQSRLDFIRIELLNNTVRAGGEFLVVIRCPPHRQVTIRVEARAGIIETVRHLVTDHGADAAVIDRVIGFWIVEGRLQNTCGKNDLVELRIVISVHGWRRHAPLSLINGLADLAEVSPELEFTGRNKIVVVSSTPNLQRLIIAPLVRITDFAVVSFELSDGLLPSFVAHPA